LALLESNPLFTDEDLAKALRVSVSTVRLDRALLGVPELRERMRRMAQKATSRLQSLKQEEVFGELLELDPDRLALSYLMTTKEMAFRHTPLVWDHYIYAQASSLAIAVVGADLVVTGAARVNYKAPAHVGDKLIARAKVGTRKGNKHVVSVRTRVGDREIFVGRFIAVACPTEEIRDPRSLSALLLIEPPTVLLL
jgi:acyl-coenzyme A thioesterase PaaI-like protein